MLVHGKRSIYDRSIGSSTLPIPRNQSPIRSSPFPFDFPRGEKPFRFDFVCKREEEREKEGERGRVLFKRETERRSDRTRFHRLLGSRFHIFSRKSFRFASIEGIRGGIVARSCESEALLSGAERRKRARKVARNIRRFWIRNRRLFQPDFNGAVQ